MKPFMDQDFLLETDVSRHLYHSYAENLPLIDYHCHISPKDIYEDRRFDNLAEVWLGGRNEDGSYFGDHYKWRLMRSSGIPEEFITGDVDGRDKIAAFAGALELAIGNPMFHWCNLELKRFFNVEKPLCSETASEIYEHCSKMLREDPELTVRGLIRKSNVAFIGTTDDPVDSLEWHEKLAAEKDLGFMVCPSIRPDKAINIDKDGFPEYIEKLAKSVGKSGFTSAEEVCNALIERVEYFKARGCRASDHGLDYIPYRPCSIDEANEIFRKRMSGVSLSTEEIEKYQTTVLLALGRTYSRLEIVMELHYSCLRNVNKTAFNKMGPDTGYDMIAQNSSAAAIAALLSQLHSTGECPKTILFSLNPSDNELLGTLIGAFQSDEIPGKIQHGAAWWFNDTKSGMEEQIKSFANLSVLGTFVGMLTDSRSFLSYTRHEYFRRIFCNLLGTWVENGEYPCNESSLQRIVEAVCYKNAKRYFNI